MNTTVTVIEALQNKETSPESFPLFHFIQNTQLPFMDHSLGVAKGLGKKAKWFQKRF